MWVWMISLYVTHQYVWPHSRLFSVRFCTENILSQHFAAVAIINAIAQKWRTVGGAVCCVKAKSIDSSSTGKISLSWHLDERSIFACCHEIVVGLVTWKFSDADGRGWLGGTRAKRRVCETAVTPPPRWRWYVRRNGNAEVTPSLQRGRRRRRCPLTPHAQCTCQVQGLMCRGRVITEVQSNQHNVCNRVL